MTIDHSEYSNFVSFIFELLHSISQFYLLLNSESDYHIVYVYLRILKLFYFFHTLTTNISKCTENLSWFKMHLDGEFSCKKVITFMDTLSLSTLVFTMEVLREKMKISVGVMENIQISDGEMENMKISDISDYDMISVVEMK